MNTFLNACAVLVLASRVAACDITGWPSTTHHPAPVRLLPSAEIVATYVLSRATPEEYLQVVRAAIRTGTGDALATVEQADRGLVLAVHLTRPLADWKVLDDALRLTTAEPVRTAVSVGFQVRALAPAGQSADRALRLLAETAAVLTSAAAGCRVEIRGGAIVATFPPGHPPAPAAVWRMRKAAAKEAGG